MKICYMYSFLMPIDEQLTDNKNTHPLGIVPIILKDGRILEAAILGTSNTVKGFRLSIPNVKNDKIDPEDFKLFYNLRKLMLDCIRATYDPSAEYFKQGDGIMSVWNFLEPAEGPSLSLRVTEPLNSEYQVNVDGIKQLFCVPPNLRPIIHLIADGGDFRLPIQFRFLSFYKIIELNYAITTNKRFNEFIKPFIPQFQTVYPKIVTSKDICSCLTTLRNRCAHIKITTGEFGFSHFEADADELFKIIPIIRQVAVKCINVNYPSSPLKFSSTPEELAKQWAEIESRGEQPIRVI